MISDKHKYGKSKNTVKRNKKFYKETEISTTLTRTGTDYNRRKQMILWFTEKLTILTTSYTVTV